jgi:hypothetical protein
MGEKDKMKLATRKHFQSRNFHAIATLAQLINPRAPYQRVVRLFVYLFIFWVFVRTADDRIIPIPRAHIFILIF